MASESQQVAALEVQIQGQWPQQPADDDRTRAVLANQLVVQLAQGHVLLTFGQMTPPILSGTPDEQTAKARELGPIPIRPLAQLAVPVEVFREMVATQQQALILMSTGGPAVLPDAQAQ